MKNFIIVIILIIIVGVFYYFSGVNKNKPVSPKNPVNYIDKDVFTYTVLLAEDPLDIDKDQGEVSRKDFLEAFETFPWNDQIKKSNELRVQSPTLSLKDNFQKKTLAISMSGDSSNTTIGQGYILAFIFRDENNQDKLYVSLTENKQLVLNLIEKFYNRDVNFKEAFLNIK